MAEQDVKTVPIGEALPDIAPGDRIRVTERIVGHGQTWLTEVEGEVVSVRAEPTGAWYAGAKGDHLWLFRILLRKDDGEISNLIVDQNMGVQILNRAGTAAATR